MVRHSEHDSDRTEATTGCCRLRLDSQMLTEQNFCCTDSKGGTQEARIVGQKIQSAQVVIGKVLVQLTAPACLIMQSSLCSLLALQSIGSSTDSKAKDSAELLPVELWLCVSNFLGALSTLLWGVVVATTVSFLRTGQMR